MTAPQFFPSSADFRRWFETHASTSTELVVGFYKVGSGRPSMTWPESVDEALCFGWIDGVRNSIDAESYRIRFTPRRATSIWSAVNIAKFKQLQSAGRMTPAGVAAFERRSEKKSAIYAYEQEATAELSPSELWTFRKQKRAWAFFDATPPGYKKVILHWVTTARKSETREKRFVTLLEACERGERLR